MNQAKKQSAGVKNHVKNQENIKKENLKNPENIAKKLKVIIEDNLANISIVCFHKLLFNYENKYLVKSLNLEVKQKFAFIILNWKKIIKIRLPTWLSKILQPQLR